MIDVRHPGCQVHASAIVEDGVELGDGTAVWDNVHIRRGSRIGRNCVVGEKTYVAYDVVIGDHCKLNASVYVCAGVTIANSVMVAAHVVFTNDRFPRAFDRVTGSLAQSAPTEDTLLCRVERGATIGANATIGPGLVIGAFSMVGMGSVVTGEVPAHGLVIGNPARLQSYVCACGPRLVKATEFLAAAEDASYGCSRCGRLYTKNSGSFTESRGPRPA